MNPCKSCLVAHPLILAPLLLLLACDAGQIGGEVNQLEDGGTSTEGGNSCEDGEITTLSVGDDTGLGFDTQTILELVRGEHESSLAWAPVRNEMYQNVEIVPASGESRIVVTVLPDTTSLRVVERVERDTSAEGEVLEEGPLIAMATVDPCRDEFRVDAEIRVTTDNGALDETLTVTLSASSTNLVNGSVSIVPGQLQGSFDVHIHDTENTEAVQTALLLMFTPGGFSGSLDGFIQTSRGDAIEAGFISYGVYPIDGCDRGALVASDSEFAAEMLTTLQGMTSFDLVWSGGNSTTLSLEHEVGRVCFESNLSLGVDEIVMPLQSKAVSADERIDGSWALEARVALGVDGSAEKLTLLRQAYLADTFPAARFEAATGIRGIALTSANDGSFMIAVEDILTDSSPATGRLAIYEIIPADCSAQERIDASQSSFSGAGCVGNAVDEVESAILSIPD